MSIMRPVEALAAAVAYTLPRPPEPALGERGAAAAPLEPPPARQPPAGGELASRRPRFAPRSRSTLRVFAEVAAVIVLTIGLPVAFVTGTAGGGGASGAPMVAAGAANLGCGCAS